MRTLITIIMSVIATVCVMMCMSAQEKTVEAAAYQNCRISDEDIMVEIKDHYVIMNINDDYVWVIDK